MRAEIRRPFNWGICIIGDAEAADIPELSAESIIATSSTAIVISVRHSQDIELAGADVVPELFEVAVRYEIGTGHLSEGAHHSLLNVPSGKLTIGDAQHESILNLTPGRWWVSVVAHPPQNSERIDLEINPALRCSVCGSNGLLDGPWQNGIPLHEISPCCGTETLS